MYSILFKKATVVDGTGKKPEILDVAITADEISNIAPNIETEALSVVDASGKILTPGFIDIQNHSDSYWQLFDNPSLESLTSQGYTTIVIGNCGASLAPLLSHDALLSIQKWHNLTGANINWQTFSEYLNQLAKMNFACNIASLVGYSTLRRGIVGDEIRSLEKNEFTSLKKHLEQSLEAGAFGLSSGLSYSHEIIISELELLEIAKILRKKDCIFSIHLRNEGAEVVEALDEALDIARASEVNLKISHLKVRGSENWHKADELLAHLENSYHKGINVGFDIYPYDTIWQPLYSYIPKWAVEGGRTTMLKHFTDPLQKNKILAYLNSLQVNFSTMLVASTANNFNFMGKTIGQIAKNMEVSSEQAVLNLIMNGGSEILVFDQNLNPENVRTFCKHPLALIGSDGAGFGMSTKTKLVHPRCFGTATKFIFETLSEKLPIETEIKKLTSAVAKKIGLKKRGSIEVGNFADLVLFDPKKIQSKATYFDPFQFSTGLEHVLVNGKEVFGSGKKTNNFPGYILRKK